MYDAERLSHASKRVGPRRGYLFLKFPRRHISEIVNFFLRRSLRFGETPKPASEMPTLPEMLRASGCNRTRPIRIPSEGEGPPVALLQ